MIIVTADGLIVTLIDIYGNKLLEFESPEPVKQLKCSSIQTDSFIVLLTEMNNVLFYDITLNRNGEPKSDNSTKTELNKSMYSLKY